MQETNKGTPIKPRRKKRKLGRIFLILLLIFVAFLALAKSRGWIGSKSAPQVEQSKVTRREIVEMVNASGKLKPETEVKISADISGEIVALPVKEGQKVKKGQLLVSIDPQEYRFAYERVQAQVSTARTNVANARAGVAQAKSAYVREKAALDRAENLFKAQSLSQSDIEVARAQFGIAEASLDAANQGVKSAQFNLESAIASQKESQDRLNSTNVYSPMDGTISTLGVELGERVVGTSQMSGTEMMRVADLSTMEVEIEVNERDIPRINVGDSANIEVSAYTGKNFKGLVTEVASSAPSSSAGASGISSDKATNFVVKVRLLEESYRELLTNNNVPFKPGMTASVDIITDVVKNAIAIPVQAVVLRAPIGGDTTLKTNQEDEEVVFSQDAGIVKQHPVKTGIQDLDYIEIKSGLEPGGTILSGPYSLIGKTLKDGDKVEVKEKGERGKGSQKGDRKNGGS